MNFIDVDTLIPTCKTELIEEILMRGAVNENKLSGVINVLFR
jgi:hypothetical protein